MEKDFDVWNKQKKSLQISGSEQLLINEREIWWCSLGVNLGSEQDGKNELFERPVLIIKKFNNSVVWILPISSTSKVGAYYHLFEHEGKHSTLLLSQLKLVSTKRFRRYIGKMSEEKFIVVKEKLKRLLS